MTHLFKIMAALLLAFGLSTGCATSGSSTASDESPEGSNHTDKKDKDVDEPEDSVLSFGDTFTYDDGLSVTVGKPAKYTPSPYAAGYKKGDTALRFNVTIVNKTGKPFDPSMAYSTLQSGNNEADEIYDSENDLNGAPSTKVLDGREVTWDIGYSCPAPNDLVLEIQPSFEYDSALYSS